MLSHLPCAVFNPHASPRDPTALMTTARLQTLALACTPFFSVSDIARILNNYKTRKPK